MNLRLYPQRAKIKNSSKEWLDHNMAQTTLLALSWWIAKQLKKLNVKMTNYSGMEVRAQATWNLYSSLHRELKWKRQLAQEVCLKRKRSKKSTSKNLTKSSKFLLFKKVQLTPQNKSLTLSSQIQIRLHLFSLRHSLQGPKLTSTSLNNEITNGLL